MLGPRFRRTSQPQQPVGIDWSNPLARGLINAFSPITKTALVGPALTLDNVSRAATRDGIAYLLPASAASRVQAPLAQSSGDFTIFTVFTPSQLTSGLVFGLFNVNAASGQDCGHYISAESGNLLSAVSTSSSNWAVASGPAMVNGTRYVLAATFTSGGGRALYINGVSVASNATARTVTGLSHAVLNAYAYNTGTYQTPISGTQISPLVWNRVLSAQEIAAISRNPWQIFAPQERSIWVPVESASGSTGTSATTNAADTSSASGTTTVVGTSGTTNAADTSAASGTTTVVGTSATTNAADTSSASGTVGGESTGTSATTNAPDTSSAFGWAGVVSGTSATTNANDTSQGFVDSGAAGGGHAYLRSNFVKARKRLALQRVLDFLTQEEPEEETKRIIRAVKAGKPVEPDKRAPVVMREVSAESLADKLIPSRIAQLPDIDLQQVIRRAIEIAQERDDEETLLLLL